jgi:excisionase family DNA binding protein
VAAGEIVRVVRADGSETEVPASVRRAVAAVLDGADLTTTEAATLLGVSREWIARLIDRGDLRGHRVGSHRRVPVEAALEYRRRQRRVVDEAKNARDFSSVLDLAASLPTQHGPTLKYPRFGRGR